MSLVPKFFLLLLFAVIWNWTEQPDAIAVESRDTRQRHSVSASGIDPGSPAHLVIDHFSRNAKARDQRKTTSAVPAQFQLHLCSDLYSNGTSHVRAAAGLPNSRLLLFPNHYFW